MASNFIVLDTEGVNIGKPKNPGNIGETAHFYDFGFIVANEESGIFDKFSFVNTDIFNDYGLMKSAYYHDKLPQYHEGMGEEWIPASTREIWDVFCKAVTGYKVRDIWAYNVNYDNACVNNTIERASNGFRRFFAPYGTRYRDIWDYAGSTLCKTQKYVNWCVEHGYVSGKGNPSTSADTVGKYVTQNLDFEEKHTALSDCEIELEILLAAKKRKQKARQSKGQGWRDVATLAREMRKAS